MKLASITGSASRSDIQIQKAVSHLLIVKTGAAAIIAETASITLQVGGQQAKIATLQKIRDLGVISQYENGYIMQEIQGDGSVKTCIMVELTGNGTSAMLSDNDYISVDLNGLVAGSNYDVYGVEDYNRDRVHLAYTSTVIAGAEPQEKAYTLSLNAKGVYIRNNGALSKVRLFGKDSGEVSYLPEELSAVAREINITTQAPDKLIEGDSINQVLAGGASEFFYVPAALFRGFEITTVGGTDLTFIVTERKAY